MTDLLVSWSHVHYYDGTIGDWRRLLEKHLVDADRGGDPALLSMYLAWLGCVRISNGEVRDSFDALRRAQEAGRLSHSRNALAYTSAWQTWTFLEIGRVAEAIDAGQSMQLRDGDHWGSE